MRFLSGFFLFHCDCRLTESGLTQGLHKTKAVNRTMIQTSTTATIVEGDDEEKETLITNRESSHEYD